MMRHLIWVVLAVLLSGCAGNFGITEKFESTNLMIKEANDSRLQGYGAAMAACGNNAACQVGVSMAFAGNMGQQQFFKPETAKDYLVAFMPYATLGADIFRMWYGGYGGDSQGMVITGDNNTLSGVGNKLTADRSSTLSASFASDYYRSSDSYVQRDSRSSSIGEGTVSDVENPVDDHSVAP